ncbi:MAG: hypothetical protein KA765_05310 [Thermoflexales bacterium]|nr:hypothetical protein [Thermoflexales bacterium]
MPNVSRNYASYLLRLWQVEQAGQVVWRATLESIQTDERIALIDAQALADFLLDRFATRPIGPAPPAGEDTGSSGAEVAIS